MGNVLPMLAALAAVPFLLHHLGQERLGVLSLVWVVVGYFSFLDMGLGRAVTVAVASCRAGGAAGQADELHVVGTASTLLLGVGGAMAVLLALGIAVWGVPVRLSSPAFAAEVTLALLWMLPSLPLLLLSSVLRGHLEGVGAFRALNLVRIPTGVMLVLGPCLTALVSPDLVWACVSILVVRLVHAGVLLWLVAQQMGFRLAPLVQALWRARSAVWLRRLLSFGGWVTVSNIVGPVIVYVDRFVIGAVLAASAVVFYAVPFDVVSRLPVLVASLGSVLLPELVRMLQGAASGQPGMQRARSLVRRSSLLSAGVVAALVAMGWLAAPWLLTLVGGGRLCRAGDAGHADLAAGVWRQCAGADTVHGAAGGGAGAGHRFTACGGTVALCAGIGLGDFRVGHRGRGLGLPGPERHRLRGAGLDVAPPFLAPARWHPGLIHAKLHRQVRRLFCPCPQGDCALAAGAVRAGAGDRLWRGGDAGLAAPAKKGVVDGGRRDCRGRRPQRPGPCR